MYINLTTDATLKPEEFVLNNSNSDQQQIYRNDMSQETKTGESKKSQMSVHSNRTSSLEPVGTSGMTYKVASSNNSEQPKRYQLEYFNQL